MGVPDVNIPDINSLIGNIKDKGKDISKFYKEDLGQFGKEKLKDLEKQNRRAFNKAQKKKN